MNKFCQWIVIISGLICLTSPAKANCPDAKIWGAKLFTDICWTCVLPIRIMGERIGGTDGFVPPGASKKKTCVCDDELGLPDFGFPMGAWQPARLIEVVGEPYCSPALGGIKLVDNSKHQGGRLVQGVKTDEVLYYDYHYYAFPLMVMLELIIQPKCNVGGYRSFDVMYLSEIDPIWSDDELAFYTNPETVAFANPIAQAACIADCAWVTAGQAPKEEAFSCAGCWGPMYPFTGNMNYEFHPIRGSSMVATRAIASLHRRGLAHKTYGDDAMCGGKIFPMIPRPQYKMSLMFPSAEANNAHWIGDNVLKWGESRNRIGQEQYLYLLWRYTDCCMN